MAVGPCQLALLLLLGASYKAGDCRSPILTIDRAQSKTTLSSVRDQSLCLPDLALLLGGQLVARSTYVGAIYPPTKCAAISLFSTAAFFWQSRWTRRCVFLF